MERATSLMFGYVIRIDNNDVRENGIMDHGIVIVFDSSVFPIR